MKMTDTDTPTVLFGIRRDRSDTGIGTMTSTPNVNELRRRLERDCETLQEQIRNTTEALRNSSPRHFSVSNSNSSGPDFKKPLVQPAAYDGSDPWEDYKVQFELVAEINGWDSRQKSMFLASSLRGAAQGVLADLEAEKRRSYEELERALSRRFGSENRTELFRVQLKNLVRKRDQTLPELGQYINRLSRKAYPSAPFDLMETLCRDHFIDALTDSDMRLRIQQARPRNIDEATKLAVELDAFNQAEKQREKRLSTSVRHVNATETSICTNDIQSCIAEISKELSDMREEMKSLKKHQITPVNKKSSKEIRCWGCGGNHYRRDCKNQKQSSAAGKSGLKPGPRSSRISKDGSGMFLTGLIGKQNQCKLKLLIDTGANVSIINSSVFERLNPLPSLRSTDLSMRMADGKCIGTKGIATLTLTLADVTVEHDFWIVDIDEDIEGILGFDFLQAQNCVLDLGNGQFHLDGKVIRCLTLSCNSIRCCRVVLNETNVIPAGSEMVLQGKVLDRECAPESGLLIPAEKFAEKYNLVIGKAVVNPTNENVPIRVLNVSDQPIKVYQRTLVGHCEAVTVDATLSPKVQTDSRVPDYLKTLLAESCVNLDDNQSKVLEAFLSENRDVFAANKEALGRTGIIKHKIDTQGAEAVKQRPRRMPFAQRAEATSQIQSMLKQDVIEKSESPWSSPIVLVRKKDGSLRFCVDYRKLNSVTKKDSFPVPRVDDKLDALVGSQWFCTLDLQSGYWQVEVDEKDREKTAFVTENGLYQFKVMPFGLCNAPATFERLMNKILEGLSWKTCLVYLDDVIVFGQDFESTLDRMRDVLSRLRAAGLKLSPKKCDLFKKKVSYLGHVVTTEGIRVDPGKIEAIREWPVPVNVTQLRSFLGLCSYYRKFIYNFAKLARPLNALTENKPFFWTMECNDAFQGLKSKLMNSPVLSYPDPKGGDFVLDTDASNRAIGAVLLQMQDGEEKVIGYFSHALGKAETNYCVTRKELLAIVEAVKHFHCYLYGRRFRLRTDHGSLRWLLNFKDIEGQLARWLQVLGTYDFEIEHRSGAKHLNADALSRRPCQDCAYCERTEQNSRVQSKCDVVRKTRAGNQNWLIGISSTQIAKAQSEDRHIGKILKRFVNNQEKPKWEEISMESVPVKTLWAKWKRLEVRDGVLHRKWEDESGKRITYQLLVPELYRADILKSLHDAVTAGHLGVNKTLSRVRERFYWPGIGSYVKDWCRKCDQCSARKNPSKSYKAPMKLYNVGAPMERIALDIMGPLTMTDQGNRYILVIGDYFTKWTEAFAIPDQEAETVSKKLVHEFICRLGVPNQVHSDQGRNFESALFSEMTKLLGIQKTRTTALHPQSDGMIERFNKTVGNMLATLVEKDQKNWDEVLPLAMMAYRSADQETTSYSPNMMMLGREARLPVDLVYGSLPVNSATSVPQYVADLKDRMCNVHEAAREHIKSASNKQKSEYDYSAKFQPYKDGDLVWLYDPKRKVGLSPKLQSYWDGPYRVITSISDLVYRVQKSPNSKPRVVHYNRLKPFHGETDVWRYVDDHQTDSDDESANSSIIDNDCDEYGRGKRVRRPVDRLDL